MKRSVENWSTAEDLAQDVFLRALERRDAFEDRGDSAMGGWLRSIAKSIVLNRNRAEERADRARERMKLDVECLAPPPTPEELAEQNRFQFLVADLRRILPADVIAFLNVWSAQRAGQVTAAEAAEELGLWLQKYEAEKKRVRRLVVRTARDLEADTSRARHSAVPPFPPR
jgi:DNA-directed RNA polymerase specialized sigma24 family protein